MRSKEAADILGLKPCSIRVLEKRGLISATRDWSGHRRFRECEVLELRKKLFPDLTIIRGQHDSAYRPKENISQTTRDN